MHAVNEERGFGFLTLQTGFLLDDIRDDIFLHIRDYRTPNGTISNDGFAALKTRETIIEFELEEEADGRVKAVNAVEYGTDFSQ